MPARPLPCGGDDKRLCFPKDRTVVLELSSVPALQKVTKAVVDDMPQAAEILFLQRLVDGDRATFGGEYGSFGGLKSIQLERYRVCSSRDLDASWSDSTG
jgi:hypothetical protein